MNILLTDEKYAARMAAVGPGLAEAVVRTIAGGQWVDHEHPAYHGRPVVPKRPTLVDPWGPLHEWVATADPETADAWLADYRSHLSAARGQPDQFSALLGRFPFPKAGPAVDRCRWALRLHNAVRQERLGRPATAYHVAAGRWGWPPMTFAARHRPTLTTFGRCVVINLDRRPGRLDRFADNVGAIDGGWPFAPIRRASGVDGWAVPDQDIPAGWRAGKGAWGCSLSHRAVLRQAIADGVSSVLVMEEDALFLPDFADRAERFLAAVEAHDPAWELVMFGGQTLGNDWAVPEPVADGLIARSRGTNRFHCYGVRGPLLADLLARWDRGEDHIDIEPWSDLLRHRRCYEPHPAWIVGQAGGHSDINAQTLPDRWWHKAVPVVDNLAVLLRAPRGVMEELAAADWHFGYNRDSETGIDLFLRDNVHRAAEFIPNIRHEAFTLGRVPAIWHPAAPVEQLRAAFAGRWVEVQAATADEAREKAKA